MAKPGVPRERPDIREKPLVPIPVIPSPAPAPREPLREPSYPRTREPVPIKGYQSSADLYSSRRAQGRLYDALII